MARWYFASAANGGGVFLRAVGLRAILMRISVTGDWVKCTEMNFPAETIKIFFFQIFFFCPLGTFHLFTISLGTICFNQELILVFENLALHTGFFTLNSLNSRGNDTAHICLRSVGRSEESTCICLLNPRGIAMKRIIRIILFGRLLQIWVPLFLFPLMQFSSLPYT